MAPKSQAITDANRRNIRRRCAETGETQAQTIAWFALVEASLCCLALRLRTILALLNLVFVKTLAIVLLPIMQRLWIWITHLFDDPSCTRFLVRDFSGRR
jgi:hypothetical protein